MHFSEILETIAHAPIEKRAMTNHGVLNEAYAYAKPSSFSRGMRIDLNGLTILLISGTASIDENGKSVHIGDFRAQMRRTLKTSPACWRAKAAPGTTSCARSCYLRDIDRDYDAFNEERTAFFKEQGLDPLPASTGIQAIFAGRNCWSRSKQSRCSALRRRQSKEYWMHTHG